MDECRWTREYLPTWQKIPFFLLPSFLLHSDKEENDNSNVKKKNYSSKKEKHKKKKKSSEYSGSSDDDLERIKKGSGRGKRKWYSSEESSDENESEGSSNTDEKRHGRKDKKQSRRKKKRYPSSSSSEDYSSKDKDRRRSSGAGKKKDDGRESSSLKEKEMGLEWMLRPALKLAFLIKMHPREMNPYMKNNGTGYPEEADEKKAGVDRLLSSSVVGDEGASWRLKSLKRAEEQAAREGRSIEEVVLERWGSLDILSEYGASRRAAAPRVHPHAIRNRKQGPEEERKGEERKGVFGRPFATLANTPLPNDLHPFAT